MEIFKDEWTIEEKIQIEQNTSNLDVLAGRAAKLSYFSNQELRTLFEVSDGDCAISKKEYEVVKPLVNVISGRISTCHNPDLGGFVIVFELFGELWISFRGTNGRDFLAGIKDLQTDLKVGQVHTEIFPRQVRVHRGFAESYSTLRDFVWDEVKLKTNSNSPRQTVIRFIGHSLGGALATISVADFHFNAYQKSCDHYLPSINGSVIKLNCRSFGCPDVGNDEFANFFNNEVKNSFRYAIHLDPVTLCLDAFPEYVHVDELVRMDEVIGRHKIENYIMVLEQWEKCFKVSNVSLMSEPVVSEETLTDGESHSNHKTYLLSAIVMFTLTVIFLRRNK